MPLTPVPADSTHDQHRLRGQYLLRTTSDVVRVACVNTRDCVDLVGAKSAGVVARTFLLEGDLTLFLPPAETSTLVQVGSLEEEAGSVRFRFVQVGTT